MGQLADLAPGSATTKDLQYMEALLKEIKARGVSLSCCGGELHPPSPAPAPTRRVQAALGPPSGGRLRRAACGRGDAAPPGTCVVVQVAAPAPIEQRWSAGSSAPLSPAAGPPGSVHSWVGVIMYLPHDPELRRKVTDQ